ncbi:MAG: sodium:calcium antiporter, partial [Azonexus sp.]
MLQHILMFILGLVALTIGAEAMVRGAARLALTLGISPLVVGLTIVAFGTSAPEMAVSAGAALNGSGDLAIGNVVGSNIANVLLILGLVALTIGAEAMVRGAARLALTLGISPLVVGLTIVAFGTSAPEMAVSAGAALNGS